MTDSGRVATPDEDLLTALQREQVRELRRCLREAYPEAGGLVDYWITDWLEKGVAKAIRLIEGVCE